MAGLTVRGTMAGLTVCGTIAGSPEPDDEHLSIVCAIIAHTQHRVHVTRLGRVTLIPSIQSSTPTGKVRPARTFARLG